MLGERSEAKHLLANQADCFPSASLRAWRFPTRQKPLGMTPDLLSFFDEPNPVARGSLASARRGHAAVVSLPGSVNTSPVM